MNEFIANVTSPGFRKGVYRVVWAGLLVAISYGKLDAAHLEVILGLVAAVLAIADSQTEPSTSVVSVATALKIEDELTGRSDEEDVAPELPVVDTRVTEAPADAWQPPSDIDWEPPVTDAEWQV